MRPAIHLIYGRHGAFEGSTWEKMKKLKGDGDYWFKPVALELDDTTFIRVINEFGDRRAYITIEDP